MRTTSPRRGLGMLAVALALVGGSVATAQAAETWAPVGAPISAGAAESPDLKRIAGVPHVAWAEDGVVRVARLSGSTWVPVGGALNADPAAEASMPSLAAGPGEVPWASWLENDDGLIRVRVARFDGASGKFVEVAPNSVINRIADPDPWLSSAVQTKLVFLDGRAHVIFRQEAVTAYEVGHVRLSAAGDSWERLTAPRHSDEPYHVTAHVAGGVLHVGTRGQIGSVFVDRYTASNTWQPLGDLANPIVDGGPAPAGGPIAITDVAGVVHVLSTVDGGSYVTRFVNGAWQNVDGPTVGESLRLIGGRLYVGHGDDDSAQVSRMNANRTGWEIPAPLPAGAHGTVVLTGISGVPYAAYLGASGRLEVARLDGTSPAGPDDSDDSEPPQPAPQPPCGREIVGTRFGDRLTGANGRDTIRGLRGDDRILGLGGADCLFGDEGHDRIEGGDGDDVLEGGAGDDRLTGGAGQDTVVAGSGDDLIDSRGRGFDVIDCGPGRDRALVGDLDRVRNCERVQNVD